MSAIFLMSASRWFMMSFVSRLFLVSVKSLNKKFKPRISRLDSSYRCQNNFSVSYLCAVISGSFVIMGNRISDIFAAFLVVR